MLFHTGWMTLLGKDDARFGSVEPGLGVGGAKYLASLDVAMVGSDTWALEVLPPENRSACSASTRFFTLGPARITGAVQGIVNPIAIK